MPIPVTMPSLITLSVICALVRLFLYFAPYCLIVIFSNTREEETVTNWTRSCAASRNKGLIVGTLQNKILLLLLIIYRCIYYLGVCVVAAEVKERQIQEGVSVRSERAILQGSILSGSWAGTPRYYTHNMMMIHEWVKNESLNSNERRASNYWEMHCVFCLLPVSSFLFIFHGLSFVPYQTKNGFNGSNSGF